MKVRVSRKLRGELSIDAIGYPVKAGQVIELSPEQEKSPNVLTSILRGLLVDVDAVKEVIKEEPVKKEETTKMTLTELNKVYQKDEVKEDKVYQEKKATEKIQEEIEASATSTNMSAFDMEKKTLLDKDDSTVAALARVNSVEIDALQVGTNIDFSDESTEIEIDPLAKKETKTVTFDIFETENAKKKPVKKAAKKTAKKKTTKKAAKKNSKTTKKNAATKNAQKKLKEAAKKMTESSIKPVGTQKKEKTTDMLVFDDSENIGFVDQEQETELLAKRPELKNNENDLF